MKPIFKISLTKVHTLLIYSLFILTLTSCKKTAGPAVAATGDFTGYTMEAIPGSTVQYARLLNAAGAIQIEGYVQDGRKTGQWIEYSPEGDINQISHYVHGQLEGPTLRMTFRNQVDLRQRYKQNQLHGEWIMYKYGKIIEERPYVHGKLEGTARTYDERTFALKQEVQYKNGLQDGYFRYYDENGNVSLEYEYKNGEKVSGGIVEPK